ncbi:MAG: DUF3014 domain-containing protein [Gammaproteobacteria bacterium]
MKKHIPWLAMLVLVGAAAALFFYRSSVQRQHPVAPPPPVAQAPVPTSPSPGTQAPAPLVRYPLPKSPGNGAGNGAGRPAQKDASLPALDNSDPTLEKALGQLFGQPALDTLFRPKSIARHLAVTVDDLSRTKLPQRYMPTRPVAGRFLVTGGQGDYAISPDNYRRYTPYVRLLEDVNVKELVSVYLRFYPLLQEAYRDLGYPSGYFNDRLMAAIDDLLATPEVTGPVKLVQPNVLYKFADPKLEALSAGQKILIRMGPRNAARVKARLREVRKALLAQVSGGERHRP